MYSLRIPKNTKEKFLVEYAKIPVEKYEPPRVEYVRVRRGDTFSGIADRNRISVSRLRAANPNIRNINRLRIGQRINMPGSVRRTASSSRNLAVVSMESASVSRENAFEYTVKRNDTLGIIAERFNTNVRTIQTLNNMGRNTKIIIGETLLIPGKPERFDQRKSATSSQTQIVSSKETFTYSVKRNDTLAAIAEKYNTNVGTLQKLNDMGRSTIIRVGQKLVVSSSQTSDSIRGIKVANAGTTKITYIVQKGDTLYEIAQKYGVDYRKIKEINEIKDHRNIKPGDKIIILK
jgi:membrane-bound lytic murein transglycosylase D